MAEDTFTLEQQILAYQSENGLASDDDVEHATEADLLYELSADALGICRDTVRMQVAGPAGKPVQRRLPIVAVDLRGIQREVAGLEPAVVETIADAVAAMLGIDMPLPEDGRADWLFTLAVIVHGLDAPVHIKYNGDTVWHAGKTKGNNLGRAMLGLIQTFRYSGVLNTLCTRILRLSRSIAADEEERMGNS